MRILHLALNEQWRQAQAAGEYLVSSRGRTLAEEGFIHASTSRQVGGVLARYYSDLDPAELTLLVIDVEALEAAGSTLQWDDVPGAADPFPHVYGPIPPAAVVGQLPLAGSPGAPVLPDLTGWDVASAAPPRG